MSRTLPQKVAQKLNELPASPGCYLMHNETGAVIYVGKAVVLRNRVRSYFHASAQHTEKTRALVAEIRDISWWVTGTELEALILENELIKQHWPHYNIRLKDDKQYPYIKINWQDDFPKVQIVRKVIKDGARYFGPYTSSRAVGQTLDALRRVFPYLDCTRTITGQDRRACLYYHLKLCGAPCIGAQSREEYRGIIRQMMDFLHGDADTVMAELNRRMERAAEDLNFEHAALYRDRIKAAQRIVEQQKIVNTSLEDEDYIAAAQDERTGDTVVQVLFVRRGRLTGRESFVLEGAEVAAAEEQSAANGNGVKGVNLRGNLIGAFMQQYYDEATFIPGRVLVQALPDTADVLGAWLATLHGARVEIRQPLRGPKRKLMQMAEENAGEYLRVQQAEWAADTNKQTEALGGLQQVLDLPRPPARMECFDISTLQGTNTVGSMVVFAKGAPLKSAYRRFKLHGKGSQGAPDDFASMRETLRRRFRRAVEDQAEPDPGKTVRKGDEQWRILPDLLVIDGGKGQLGVAVEVLEEFGLTEVVPVVGLAKQEEEIFVPGRSQSIWLKRGSPALHLVQRLRDEAHRWGIAYHRNLRSKAQTRSLLDEVSGIGPSRRKALLSYYAGDLDKIRAATVDELAAIPGMTRKAAQAVKNAL